MLSTGMKEIPLSRGYVALVDDADYPALAQHCWRVQLSAGLAYAVRTKAGKVYLMHREILGACPGQYVDHVRHRRDFVVDNRRVNLRFASAVENGWNRGKPRGLKYGRTSIFKGVRWDNERSVWRVQITEGRRRISLGRFRDEGQAATVFDLAAVKSRGEFAVTNFPVPGSKRWLFGPQQDQSLVALSP